MEKRSRRDFLRASLAAGGAWALSPAVRAADPAPAAVEAATAANISPTDPASMAIARWSGSPPVEVELASTAVKLTGAAIDALGGMKRFVTKGDVVWVKPNIGWNRAPEYAANTNPDVVGALVRLCLDAGAKRVKVGDHTCNDARQSYTNSGIAEAVRKAGGEIVYLDPNRFKETELRGEYLKSWPLYPEIIECDLVINVPIAKHHGLSEVTLCMKNYMGVIGGNRGAWHQELPQCLCDITAYMKPRLCVLDAVRVLTGNGPSGGNLEDVQRRDVVAAGVDIVALDAFGAELLGHAPGDIASVAAGQRAGLGTMDYRASALCEISLS